MENKTTSELLELLQKLPDSGEETWGEGGKYEKLMGELKTRHPFYDILNADNEDGLPAVWEAIKIFQSLNTTGSCRKGMTTASKRQQRI